MGHEVTKRSNMRRFDAVKGEMRRRRCLNFEIRELKVARLENDQWIVIRGKWIMENDR